MRFARRLIFATLLCVPIACPKSADAAAAMPSWRASPVFAKMHREVPECRMTSER